MLFCVSVAHCVCGESCPSDEMLPLQLGGVYILIYLRWLRTGGENPQRVSESGIYKEYTEQKGQALGNENRYTRHSETYYLFLSR